MKRHLMPLVSLAALMASAQPAALMSTVRNEASPGNIEKLLGEVKQELTRVGGEVKKIAEDALKQATDAGTVTAEVKKKADDLLTAQSKLNDAQSKLEGKLEQLETRNTDLEQKLAERLRGGGDGDKVKSFGAQVTESEDFKAYAKAGARGSIRLPVKQAITSAGGSAGPLIWPDRDRELVQLPRRQLFIRQLLTQSRTVSNMVEYARQLARTNNAAVVTEGAQKPESNYTWERTDAPVRTIAHWVPVSRNAMDDIPMLQGEIDGELRYGLQLAEELEVLKGDGTGEHLHGLVPQASAFVRAFNVADEQSIDILRLALLQASLAEFPADGIVLHPTDWARIELLKDGEQRYLFAQIISMVGPQLWGRPVVETQAMDVDEFLVGAFRTAATIYDRMDAEVLISSEDRDNFIKNMLTVRAEERLALAVKRPAALVTGDFGIVT